MVQRQEEPEEEEETIQTKLFAGQTMPLIQTQAEPEEEEEEEQIQTKLASQSPLIVQTQQLPEGLEEDGRVLLKKLPRKMPQVSHMVAKRLSITKGLGRPLPDEVRSFMEPRFGVDFSHVRIHTDNNAAQMARDLNATAFTHAGGVYFNSGRYNPDSQSGKRLLAHELTHVIQQSSGDYGTYPSGTILTPRKPSFQQPQVRISRINPHHSGLKRIQRQVEVHVNLRQPQKVKLFRKDGVDTVFSPVSAGTNTESLIATPITTYSITKRKDPLLKQGRWGLQYFARFHDGIGFHSNITYPRRETLCKEGIKKYCKPKSKLKDRLKWILKVDGTPRSHGCVRMKHSDAPRLFNAVSDGISVRVYKRRSWRKPLWS